MGSKIKRINKHLRAFKVFVFRKTPSSENPLFSLFETFIFFKFFNVRIIGINANQIVTKKNAQAGLISNE